MEAKEAFALLWGKIYNPRSAYPDVELGAVHDTMVEILMGLGQGPEEERWVMARVALHPHLRHDVLYCWAERCFKQVKVPEYSEDSEKWEAYYDREEQVTAAARLAMGKIVDDLLANGRVLKRDGYLVLP